jgi:hypothetical protein
MKRKRTGTADPIRATCGAGSRESSQQERIQRLSSPALAVTCMGWICGTIRGCVRWSVLAMVAGDAGEHTLPDNYDSLLPCCCRFAAAHGRVM